MESADKEKQSAAMTEESPADFLANLGSSLQVSEDVDVDLAKILTEFLLITTPAPDAVIKAKNAIHKLALERANPPASAVSHE